MTTIEERDNKRLRCVENALPKRTHEVRNRLQNGLVHLGSLLYLSLSSKLRLDSAPVMRKQNHWRPYLPVWPLLWCCYNLELLLIVLGGGAHYPQDYSKLRAFWEGECLWLAHWLGT
jgi:hypothetical protein